MRRDLAAQETTKAVILLPGSVRWGSGRNGTKNAVGGRVVVAPMRPTLRTNNKLK